MYRFFMEEINMEKKTINAKKAVMIGCGFV